MSELHVLITEAHAIEALSICAIIVDCVTSKNAEVLNYFEELGPCVLYLLPLVYSGYII